MKDIYVLPKRFPEKIASNQRYLTFSFYSHSVSVFLHIFIIYSGLVLLETLKDCLQKLHRR